MRKTDTLDKSTKEVEVICDLAYTTMKLSTDGIVVTMNRNLELFKQA